MPVRRRCRSGRPAATRRPGGPGTPACRRPRPGGPCLSAPAHRPISRGGLVGTGAGSGESVGGTYGGRVRRVLRSAGRGYLLNDAAGCCDLDTFAELPRPAAALACGWDIETRSQIPGAELTDVVGRQTGRAD